MLALGKYQRATGSYQTVTAFTFLQQAFQQERAPELQVHRSNMDNYRCSKAKLPAPMQKKQPDSS